MEASEKLIEQVAKRCYVSSEDNLIKERLNNVINNAIYNVRALLGISDEDFDFSKYGMENELFLNYCMYRWNNRSQKEFEENYMGDIIAIRSKYEVAYSKKINEEQQDE